MRLLIVEDNEDTADSLCLLLMFWGHEVKDVHTGVEALQAVQADKPDAVLLDLGLPGMDGYQVARRLRQLPGYECLPIIAVTAFGLEEDKKRSKESGINHHLVKPFNQDELAALLNRL
jgi:CheY-like chemotaxis protein